MDPEDGVPWEFSLEVKRRRAVALLERDKPLLLVACPMCWPFNGMQNINYTKRSREEVKK